MILGGACVFICSTLTMMGIGRFFLWTVLLLCGFFLFTFSSFFVFAAESVVRITEILYNADGADTGKEYVEIINTGPGQIDMTTVKFFERQPGIGRAVRQGKGSAVLQSGDVAVIVADPDLFLQNYEEYDLNDAVILDTSGFALLNAGATVSLEQDGRLLHSVTYSNQNGADGNGDALHIADNDAISAGNPSAGSAHGVTVSIKNTVNTDEFSAVAVQESHNKKTGGVSLVIIPLVIFPASTTKFSAVRTEDREKKVLYGSWNFGDGTYVHGDVIEHSYLHQGVYIITFQEHTESEVGVVLQEEVVVMFPRVTVKRLNEAFVLLHNHHPFVLDVSEWQLVSEGSVFVFPDNSLVLFR